LGEQAGAGGARVKMLDVSSYSVTAQRTLAMAAAIARARFRNQSLLPEHLAYAISEQEAATARTALTAAGIDLFRLRSLLTASLESTSEATEAPAPEPVALPTNAEPLPLAPYTVAVLNQAQKLAAQGSVATGHLLEALLLTPSMAGGILSKLGLTPERLRAELARIADRGDAAEPVELGIIDLVALAQSGKLPLLLPRPRYTAAAARALLQHYGRGVMLAGEPGSGRWSIVQALAAAQAQAGAPALGGILALARDLLPDDPRATVQRAVDRASGSDMVLAVPEAQRFFAQPAPPFFKDAGAILRRAAQSGVRLLVTTTPAGATLFEGDDTLRDLLRIDVEPATADEARQMLELLRPTLEQRHKLTIAPSAPGAAVEMASRYLPGVLPSKAVHLLDAACAEYVLHQSRGAAAEGDVVDEGELARVVESRTGIPLGQIVGPEQERLARMEEILKERIAGQDEAVRRVSQAIRRARAGLRDPKRPIASFLFMGPTGVGKTELGNALAEFLFNDETAQIRLDMSEYQERNSTARLIGAPPGYVGYEEGGQLTEAIRKRPYALVLFDEIEKAHPEVFNTLLQVLENGRLTDGKGRTADFRNAVIILTSNAGSEFLTGRADPKAEEEAARDALRQTFRPEFINRLDSIVVFHHLDEASLRLILGLMLNKTRKLLLANRRIELTITDAAKEWLFNQVPREELAEYGARPLRRLVADRVEAAIADAVFAGTFRDGEPVTMDGRDGALVFEKTPPAPAVVAAESPEQPPAGAGSTSQPPAPAQSTPPPAPPPA
jgi:ATP-dependent Clp protease ATP-binding subunit ClpC